MRHLMRPTCSNLNHSSIISHTGRLTAHEQDGGPYLMFRHMVYARANLNTIHYKFASALGSAQYLFTTKVERLSAIWWYQLNSPSNIFRRYVVK